MSKVPDRKRPSLTARIGISVPAAVGALLFAGAVAFGSGMVDTFVPGHGGEAAYHGGHHAGHAGGTKGWHPKHHRGDGDEDSKQPYHYHPINTPKPEPTLGAHTRAHPVGGNEPPAPVVEPPADNDNATLTLNAEWLTGKVKFTWSAWTGDGFGYYKLVRSKDADVTWPPGGNDSLVAYISDPHQTFAKDFPGCGKTWFYRVFVVTSHEAGLTQLAASNVVSGQVACGGSDPTKPPSPTPAPTPTPAPPTPAPTPWSPPAPGSMASSLGLIDGGVHLTWEKATSPEFVRYEVVRSMTNADPQYPLNAGTELMAEITNVNTTSRVDTLVNTGETWNYRVYSMGQHDGTWYVLGMTSVQTATIP